MNDPVIHNFEHINRDSVMYAITQTNDLINDGDLFLYAGGELIGMLAGAWPVLMAGEQMKLRLAITNRDGLDRFNADGWEHAKTKYAKSFTLLGAMVMANPKLEVFDPSALIVKEAEQMFERVRQAQAFQISR